MIQDLTKTYSEEEIRIGTKNALLMLLRKFIGFCNNRNLKYFLDYGTLLGAVRDGGLIPWDYDIDISMPREDYNILLDIGESMSDDKVFFQTAQTDSYFETFAKLRAYGTTFLTPREFSGLHNRGIFIDIFPIDIVPHNIHHCEDIAGFVRTVGKHSNAEKSHDSRIFNVLNQTLTDITTKNRDSNYVANVTYCRYDRTMKLLDKSAYDHYVYTKFEDLSVKIPAGYLHILESWYGKDWRIPRQVLYYEDPFFIDPFNDYTKYNGCTKDDYDKLILNLKK